MEVITTHINTDFDGLAAMVAAGRIYPGARLVLPGGVDRNVKHFQTLHGDLLDISTIRDLPRGGIGHLIMVDTQMKTRLGEMAELVDWPDTRVTIYDHHPSERADFEPNERFYEPVGAATTMLLKIIRERRLTISPFEATLFALGIYFDTGSFTFAGTTPDDLDAAAYLLRCGANLDVVAEYLHFGFTDEQRALLSELIRGADTHVIRGVTVALACVRTASYIGEAAAMASKLMELENAEAVFLLALMDDDLYLIGRSQTDRLDVAEVLREWGGGGHPRAASAHTRLDEIADTGNRIIAANGESPAPAGDGSVDIAPDGPGITDPFGAISATDGPVPVTESPPSASKGQASPARTAPVDIAPANGEAETRRLNAVTNRLLALLKDRIVEEPRAAEIMSRPARTVTADASIDEAATAMQRYGHSGLSVLENGRLAGVISRRDVDKARHHQLTHAPVKGFMARAVTTVSPEDPLSILEARMLEHDVGRLPVVKDGRLMGVVTRSDLLRARHGARYIGKRRSVGAKLESSVPAPLLKTLRQVGMEGDDHGIPVYLVGGFVRDVMMSPIREPDPLHSPGNDLDLVTEGDAIQLAERLAESLGARVRTHPRFGTATLVFPDGSHLDLATARTESYSRPAALPEIERSSIEDDLRRRDFTMNAMAIHLSERRFGELLDPHHGMRDIRRREVRVLHNLSFIEDPTRIMRAARFGARFLFSLEPRTHQLALEATRDGRLATLSPERFRRELLRGLEESHALEVARRWQELGVLHHLSPRLRAEENPMEQALDSMRWFASLRQRETPNRPLLLLAALLSPLTSEKVRDVCEIRLRLPPAKAQLILDCTERGPMIARSAEEWDPAEMVRRMKTEKLEVALFAVALNPAIRDKMSGYYQTHRFVRLDVSGGDLIEQGYRPGPAFSVALRDALDEKLRGRLPTKKQEMDYIVKRLKEEY